MAKFEHTFVSLNWQNVAKKPNQILEMLNDMQGKGWELVTVVDLSTNIGRLDYYFKRPAS